MQYNLLGNTGIRVSKICFGSLTIGPLQKNLPIKEGVGILEKAVDYGINFIDTADLYGTYPYIKEVVKKNRDLVIATKSYAYNRETAEQTLRRALDGIGRDYVDIFLLHEQESIHTIHGHREALDYFIEQKEKGLIRAVGISTHYIAAVKSAALLNEIDVIHPILNFRGLGIVDGPRSMMEQAIESAYRMGKGIYIMKPLGGGHCIKDYHEAFKYALEFPYAHAIAIGMQRLEELEANICKLEGLPIPPPLESALAGYKRTLLIQDWCQACGECVRRCSQGALRIGEEGIAAVDKEKCILCGYCGSVCKELAIKVI